MARDRLAGVVSPACTDAGLRLYTLHRFIRCSLTRPQNRNYGDQSNPQPSYPPSNGVIAQQRGGNPYAQQDAQPYGAPQQPQGGAGGYGGYGQQQAAAYGGGDGGNPYAQQGQQQYGQQQGYAAGGAGGAGQEQDFWSELSATNSLLGQLQEQIQAVRTAHQQSLVSAFINFQWRLCGIAVHLGPVSIGMNIEQNTLLIPLLRPRPTRKPQHTLPS